MGGEKTELMYCYVRPHAAQTQATLASSVWHLPRHVLRSGRPRPRQMPDKDIGFYLPVQVGPPSFAVLSCCAGGRGCCSCEGWPSVAITLCGVLGGQMLDALVPVAPLVLRTMAPQPQQRGLKIVGVARGRLTPTGSGTAPWPCL